MSESSQGMFNIMNKTSVESSSGRKAVLYNPVAESGDLKQKVEEIENVTTSND